MWTLAQTCANLFFGLCKNSLRVIHQSEREQHLLERQRLSVLKLAVRHNDDGAAQMVVQLSEPVLLGGLVQEIVAVLIWGCGGGDRGAHLLHTDPDFVYAGVAEGRVVVLTRPVVTDYMRE